MKKIGLTLVLAFCATLLIVRAEPPDPDWETDFAAARMVAAKEHRTMLVVFLNSESCFYSQRFQKDVLNQNKFAKYVRLNKFVLAYLDFPRRGRLPPANLAAAAGFGVKTYPTSLILDDSGKLLGSVVGTTSLDNFKRKLDEILQKASAK
ncbi:MAG: thioredoxin family protein [Victivallaceae bacterium]